MKEKIWFEWQWIIGGVALFYGSCYLASLVGFGPKGILLIMIAAGPVLVVAGIVKSIRTLWKRRR